MINKKINFKFLVLFLLLFMFKIQSAFTLGIDTSVLSIDMHPDFWAGIFPSSVTYMVSVTGLEFLPTRKTTLGVKLSTGTEARKFTCDPLSGIRFKDLSDSSEPYIKYILEHSSYDSMYANWKLGLTQGFFHSPNETEDFITLSLDFIGHWEANINPILQTESRTGFPFNQEIFTPSEELNNKILFGTPDLSGNRQLIDMGFSFSGTINGKIHKTANDSGLYLEFETLWMPSAFNISSSTGGRSDFFKFWAYASYDLMLFRKRDDNEKNIFGFGLTTDIEFRYLNGKYIPKYAEQLKATVWYAEPENAQFLLRNTTKFHYYGQQFFKSWVPRAYLFLDVSYAWGNLNNVAVKQNVNIWTGTAGIHIELQAFDMIHVYYEFGKLFMYTGSNADYYKGYFSSETLKFALSISI